MAFYSGGSNRKKVVVLIWYGLANFIAYFGLCLHRLPYSPVVLDSLSFIRFANQ
ncbi:MAG: hypothetical protein LBV71_00255 [Prevotella sp.]|jgi:hypothetical protein|nr:hypothetical protein [Prevotella sp.]